MPFGSWLYLFICYYFIYLFIYLFIYYLSIFFSYHVFRKDIPAPCSAITPRVLCFQSLLLPTASGSILLELRNHPNQP